MVMYLLLGCILDSKAGAQCLICLHTTLNQLMPGQQSACTLVAHNHWQLILFRYLQRPFNAINSILTFTLSYFVKDKNQNLVTCITE